MTPLLICPEDELRILVEAKVIPDGAIVTKRQGETRYTLKRDLMVYTDIRGEKPMKIEGTFLMSANGGLNQVRETSELLWIINAGDLVEDLNFSWEGSEQ